MKSSSPFSLLLLTTILAALTPTVAKAHFIWLEEECSSSPCEVRVYFGEYAQNVREKLSGRLSERKATKVKFLGDTQNWAAPVQNENFLSIKEPSKAGEVVAIENSSEVVDLTKYKLGIVRPIYYARTLLKAFHGDKAISSGEAFDIVPITLKGMKVGSPVEFQINFNGTPLKERAEIRVYAPNGWSWEGERNENGVVAFTPLWPGLYVAEVIYLEEKPGEFNGKPYEGIRHRGTLTIKVAK